MKEKLLLMISLFLTINLGFGQITVPANYTDLNSGNISLFNETINTNERWYKWTNDSTTIHLEVKINRKGSNYQIRNIEFYVLNNNNNNLYLTGKDTLLNDSTLNIWNRDLLRNEVCFIKINSEFINCEECAKPAGDIYNITLNNISIITISSLLPCEYIVDGGMEQYWTGCNINLTQTNLVNSFPATHWKRPNTGSPNIGTSDYFLSCAPANPINYSLNASNNFASNNLCTVNPLNGNAYIGMILMTTPFNNPPSREYVYNQLAQPLQIGKTYQINLQVRLACFSKYAISNLQMYFTTNAPIQPLNGTTPTVILPNNGSLVNLTTQVIQDKTGWTTISACFTPTANFSYITLGNFQPYGTVNFLDLDPNNTLNYSIGGTTPNTYNNTTGYYYFDNVSIKEIDLEITGNNQICLGGSTQLNTNINCINQNNGSVNYIWMPSNGLSNPNIANPIASPTTSTIYTLTAQVPNNAGQFCTVTNTFEVIVSPSIQQVSATAQPNPICPGQTSLLSSFGASTYTWLPNNLNTNTILVSPTITTNYTVISTNGCGTSSAVVTVTVHPNTPPSVNISSSDYYPCIGSSITLSANVSPIGTYTYNWMSNPTLNNQTAIFTPTNNGSYTVKVTDQCGNTSTSNICISVVSNKCCQPAETINNATIYSNGSPYLNIYGGAYKVYGTITIAANVNWSNAEFRMQPGAKIYIIQGAKLSLNNCKIYSCADMWEGITLEAGIGNLSHASINVNNSIIEDAYRAISYDAQNKFYVDNINVKATQLNKNHTGIYLANTIDEGIAYSSVYSNGSAFTSSATPTSPGNSLKNASVFINSCTINKPVYGVYFNNVKTQISLGDGSWNLFQNLTYGYYGVNSWVRISNSHFDDLKGQTLYAIAPNQPVHYGVGVMALNPSGANHTFLSVQNCKFTNIWKGVFANGSQEVSIGSTTFSNTLVSNGLCSGNCTGSSFIETTNHKTTANIANNRMTNVQNAILHYYTLTTVPTFSLGIGQNTITATSNGLCNQAISIQSAINNYTTSPASISIANNLISNVQNGILSVNNKNGLRVSNNKITIQYAASGNRHGIRLNGTENAFVDNNTINSTNITNQNISGIYMQLSPNCNVQCNTINTLGRCVVYDGNNTKAVTGFILNSMSNSHTGLYITNNGIIGNQGQGGNLITRRNSNNTWNGNFTFKTYVNIGSSAQNSKLYVSNNSTNNPFFGNNIIANDGSVPNNQRYGIAPFVNPSTIITQAAVVPFTCAIPLNQASKVMPIQLLNDFAELLTKDADLWSIITNTSNINQASAYMQKQFVYGLLKRPQYITNDALLQNFISQNQNTGLERYHTVDSLIKNGLYILAKNINMNSSTANDIEQNQKDVNTQLLNKLIYSQYQYSDSEVELVETIAHKCPLTDGNAVYQARTLLQTIKQQYMLFTDSCNSDKPNGARMEHTDDEGNTITEQLYNNFVLYPNPNNGNMQLLYSVKPETQAIIMIYDIAGKQLYAQKLEVNTNLITLNLDALSDGIYYYKIISTQNEVLKSDKLIIIK